MESCLVEDHESVEAGRYCPACGYDQTGNLVAGVERCAECGLEYAEADLLPQPPLPAWLQLTLRALKACLTTVLIAGVPLLLIGLILPAFACTCRSSPATRARVHLQQIHMAHYTFAQENGGSVPIHPAELVLQNYLGTDLYEDPRSRSDGRFIFDRMDLRNFDFESEQTRTLLDAISTFNSDEQIYDFGHFSFARLDRVTMNGSIVFGWSRPDENGMRIVVFDDNHVDQVARREWLNIWAADTEARETLDMKPLFPRALTHPLTRSQTHAARLRP